jgi:hypothetical protein
MTLLYAASAWTEEVQVVAAEHEDSFAADADEVCPEISDANQRSLIAPRQGFTRERNSSCVDVIKRDEFGVCVSGRIGEQVDSDRHYVNPLARLLDHTIRHDAAQGVPRVFDQRIHVA